MAHYEISDEHDNTVRVEAPGLPQDVLTKAAAEVVGPLALEAETSSWSSTG